MRREPAVLGAWRAYRVPLLRVAVGLLSVYAALKLGDECQRLLFDTGPDGATDLFNFRHSVRVWFGGAPAYGQVVVYPPASFAMLWLLVGWLDAAAARWLWALGSAAALIWLARLLVRASGAPAGPERVFVALMPFSLNATGVAIGNAQLVLLILPALLASVLRLREPPSLQRDLVASALMLFALVKPSVSAPFFWIAMLAPHGLRTALLTTAAYGALTAVAASYQPQDLLTLTQEWLRHGTETAALHGYANLAIWLAQAGLKGWIVPSALFVLAALGVWIHRQRHGDPWITLGVTALVARFWTYHWNYDDVLVVVPMVALFRVARTHQSPARALTAGVLLGLTQIVMLFPARWELGAGQLREIYVGGHAAAWAADLMFLLALRERKPDTDQSA